MFAVHLSSEIPLRYKRNARAGELYKFKKIASDLSNELKRIKIKHLPVGFPIHIINEILQRFNQEKMRY